MNTQNANIHTQEEIDTNEIKDAARQLSQALHKLSNEHGGSPDKTGVKQNKNGSYEIFIDKGPTLWFHDEVELAGWIMGVNNND